MSDSCHLDRVSNVEIGVECQIFVIVIFFNSGQVLKLEADSWYYYRDAFTLKSLIEEHARLDFSDILPPCSQFSPLLVYYFT